ncbi:hypothetical protein ABEB36_007341 [Hypothenemus hampei]|uniref:Cas12f1-like TNB domain-containing protein n=1 Tax=Hypothenemus hampei TaxID=57062 RepID=A0ABD1EWR8_HYPHA
MNIKIKVHKDRKCFPFSTNGVDASLLMKKFSGRQQDDGEKENQQMYGWKTVTRLKFNSWKWHRKATNDLGNELLFPPGRMERNKKVLVCFEDDILEPGISYGRNLKPAVVELKKAFHKRGDKCDVRDVNEFRTSRRCSRCYKELRMPPRLADLLSNEERRRRCHGHHSVVSVYQNCPTMYNRNTNAARNIVLVATGLMKL